MVKNVSRKDKKHANLDGYVPDPEFVVEVEVPSGFIKDYNERRTSVAAGGHTLEMDEMPRDLIAIKDILNILAGLSTRQQERVLSYLQHSLNVELKSECE